VALVYATDLNIRKTGSSRPATIEQIAGIVARWAGIVDPLEELIRDGRRGSVVQTELLVGGADESRAWRLWFRNKDPNDAATTWTVSVAAIEGLTTDVSIRLDRTRGGNLLRPTRDSPAPPGCIRALLESVEVEVVDGGRALGLDVWVPSDDEAHAVAELVMSPDRRLPVFAFSLRDDDVIDGSDVSRDLIGLAHVILIGSRFSWLLQELLPTGMNVYGGAARLWWPGLTLSSQRWDHPLWTADVSAHDITRNVVESVVNAAVTHAGTDIRIINLERHKRDHEHQTREIEIQRLRTQLDEALTLVEESGGQTGVTELAESIAHLLMVERQARLNAEEERDLMESLGRQVEDDLKETRRRLRDAELECSYLKSQFSKLRQSSSHLDDEDSTASILQAEIEREILTRGEVEGARPRPFKVGRQFMSILETVGQGNRNKVIKACADIVSNATGLLGRRDDHSLRSGPGANNPEILRDKDGARARRCAIEQGSPSARRIHYWVLADQTIEFASINVHDDFNIPT